jgi:hypothetical protein
MSALALLPFAAEASVAEEGKHIIIGMLIVALVFIGVILVGQLFRHMGHRRKARKRAQRVY